MTNNIVNCCENASSAFPNDHNNTNSGEENHRKASMNQHNQPNGNIIHNQQQQQQQQPNHNNNINKQSNGHLVQMYSNEYHENDHHQTNVNNDDDYCTKSPYESTTISNHNIKNNKKSPFSSMMATATSSSPPPPYHNNDDIVDDNNERQRHLNQISSYSSNSIWNIIHMILVVIASASINGIVFGVVNNFGVFYAHLTELSMKDLAILGFNDNSKATTDDENIIDSSSSSSLINKTNDIVPGSDALVQSLIAGVGSLNVGLIFFCSIFASVLSDRYGIRNVCFFGGVLATIGMYASSVSLNWIYLYITYGLVLGIGASLVYGPSLAILGHYFTKRLGLVNGLVTAGSSAFSIIMPFALRWLIDQVGIQSTFKYLSILMATLILCSLTFKEQIKRPNQKKHGSAKKNLANMFFYDALWKNNLYLYWVISIPVGLFGYFVPFCHLVKHAREINSFYQGEVLVMSIGVTSMLGRLITGPLADVSHLNRICLQQFAFASIGLLTMCLPFVRDFPLLLVCCGLGLFDGCFISLLGPIAFDLVGPEYANQAIGLLLCFCSLPLTTGPPIAAYAYGIYGNYKLAFCLAGIPPIIAAVLMFNIIRMQRMQRRRTSTVKLGIDEPRCLFDEVMIVNRTNNDNISNDGNENNKQINNSLINGEKLHLLINGNDNNIPQHPQHTKGINGTTKLTIPSLTNNQEDSGFNNNEKTGLLLNGDAVGGNNIVILSKDHHHHHQPQQKPPQNSSSSSSSSSENQSRKSSIRI